MIPSWWFLLNVLQKDYDFTVVSVVIQPAFRNLLSRVVIDDWIHHLSRSCSFTTKSTQPYCTSRLHRAIDERMDVIDWCFFWLRLHRPRRQTTSIFLLNFSAPTAVANSNSAARSIPNGKVSRCKWWHY